MELTLTGATLGGGGGGGGGSGSGSISATAATSSAAAATPQAQHQHQHGPGCPHSHSHSHDHSHSHSHSHDHSHTPQPNATTAASLPAGTQRLQIRLPTNSRSPISAEQIRSQIAALSQNPPALFLALVGTLKAASFESFQSLADGVRGWERDHGSIVLKAKKDDGDGDATDSNSNSNSNTNTNTNTNTKNASKSLLAQHGSDGHTLPHWAAKRSDDVRFLDYLSNIPGVNVHVASLDGVGMYPIHWSCTEGSIALVAFLLKKLGGDGDGGGSGSGSGSGGVGSGREKGREIAPNSTGSTVQSSNRSIDAAASSSANHSHSHHNHSSSSSSIVDPLSARDASGCTPLLVAAQYGHADLAAFLLKRGADGSAVDSSRDAALHWAAYKGSVPVCGLLLHLHGAGNHHLDGVDVYGQTPLHLASLRGNVEVVQYLLEEAENYAAKGSSGSNSGSSISDIEQPPAEVEPDFVARLLNVRDKDGKTALDLAVKKKRTGCEVMLRDYTLKHCAAPPGFLTLCARTVREMFSVKAWKVWMGLTPEAAMGAQIPQFPYYFAMVMMVAAFLYYPLVFVPVWIPSEEGLLWDIMPLHIFSLFNQLLMWISFIMVGKVDPGIVGNASSSSSSMDFEARGSAYAASCGLDPNADIRSEMDGLTRALRRRYDETLEEYSREMTGSNQKVDHPPLCHSCRIVKPLRSKHCRVTRRCVLLFDHYCPFVGTTIGLYNYKYFLVFLISMTLALLSYIGTLVLYTIRSPKIGFGSTTLGIFISIIIIPVSGLLIYHAQLIWKNLTTNEHQNMFRYAYLQSGGAFRNPFDRGCCRNLLSRCMPGEDAYVMIEDEPPVVVSGKGKGKGVEVEMTSQSKLEPSESVISSSSGKSSGGAERRLIAKRRKSDAEEKKDLLANVV